MPETSWNADLYEGKHAFVWQYGADIVELLSPQPGERILDLGCGTGQLTEKIASLGAEVMGIDSSAAMITKAEANYPTIPFAVADARNFQVAQPLDAVFSNAALHWVKEADAVISCIRQALKPGGRFVAEFGGKGNIYAIASTLFSILESTGSTTLESLNPWYFPSIGDYATRLEKQGFDVTYAVLFDRPTPLADKEAGLANWIRMFASTILAKYSAAEQDSVIATLEQRLKPTLYRDGTWIADYRRLRVVAIKS
ncbi:Methyltransferase type 11 [Crinalium epipsammum PCC 9333]|uniref:Methyltransferase type 11 n=1 Tax=Crinalium epipsammum PCC 9333 TaxID=1173022 RepID=K9VTB3_9CYAN|nr:methyltransferase domain-containing protein [Crinalium epipsammum]AFZ11166.1 Methyltransferase type 11 [Crinalium epipsammum PCC 9333]